MSILEFVDQNELDDLDEDPRMAFMQLVNAAQRSLSSRISVLDTDNQNDWQKIDELRYSFMNVVVAAAKRFEIEPFHSIPWKFLTILTSATATIASSSLTWTTTLPN